VIQLAGGEAGAVSAKTFDYNFPAADSLNSQEVEDDQLDRTMTSVLDKTNDNMLF
jgi:hypothetical protein